MGLSGHRVGCGCAVAGPGRVPPDNMPGVFAGARGREPRVSGPVCPQGQGGAAGHSALRGQKQCARGGCGKETPGRDGGRSVAL